MSAESCHDALVIGAGPAGAVAARELARRGCSVLLVDKARFPRPKVCGCCLSTVALRALQRLGLGHVVALSVPLRDVCLAAGRRSARVKLPGGVALSREAFDLALVNEAVRAGVELREGVTAKLGESGAREVAVRVGAATGRERTEAISARVAIVASGLAGNETPPEADSRIGAGASVPPELAPAFFEPGTIFMATARGGYVGLVRLEDGRLDVAAAFDASFVKACGGIGTAAEAVLAETSWPRIVGLAELPWKGVPALTRRATALGGERWFAVGDAAGYVEPFTGEGMAWALMSASALAPIAARAVHNWEPALAREWAHTYRRILGNRQWMCRVVSRALRSPALMKVAVRALSVFPALARPLVSALNRPPLLGVPA